jgi:zinc transporter ZupT
LPESGEKFESYFKGSSSLWSKLPNSSFLAFASYSLILFVEKVAFDSHALIEHDHGDGHGHGHSHGHEHEHDDKKKKSEKELESKNSGNKKEDKIQLDEKLLNRDNHNQNEDDDSDSDLEEEAMKNVVSSRGKFASFMQMRNSMINVSKSFANNIPAPKQDKALTKASMILTRTLGNKHQFDDNEDMQFMVNPKNVHLDEENRKSLIQQMVPSSNITPFLLLVALSLHGFFEGIALGIQKELKDAAFLTFAILAHKWAEAFTLVRLILNYRVFPLLNLTQRKLYLYG